MITLNTTKPSLLFAFFIAFSSYTYAADEAALYDLAPPGSAFIRIISSYDSGSLTAKFGNTELKIEGLCQASPYSYIEPGKYNIDVNTVQWSGELESDKTYTFIVARNEISVQASNVFDNPKKGNFKTYNLTDKNSISVKTVEHGKPVLKDISIFNSDSRLVNPIKIGLAIHHDDEKLKEVSPTLFQRGKTSSLFICGNDNKYLASWSVD